MFSYKKVLERQGDYIPAEYAVHFDGKRVGTLMKATRGPWQAYVGWGESKYYVGKYYGCSPRKPITMLASYFGVPAKIR